MRATSPPGLGRARVARGGHAREVSATTSRSADRGGGPGGAGPDERHVLVDCEPPVRGRVAGDGGGPDAREGHRVLATGDRRSGREGGPRPGDRPSGAARGAPASAPHARSRAARARPAPGTPPGPSAARAPPE